MPIPKFILRIVSTDMLETSCFFQFEGRYFWRNLLGKRNGKILDNYTKTTVIYCSVHIYPKNISDIRNFSLNKIGLYYSGVSFVTQYIWLYIVRFYVWRAWVKAYITPYLPQGLCTREYAMQQTKIVPVINLMMARKHHQCGCIEAFHVVIYGNNVPK